MATAKLFLFIGKKYKCGNSPVMLRVTHQRKNRYISLGDSFRGTSQQWEKTSRRFNSQYKHYRTKNKVLAKLEVRANDIIDDFTKNGTIINYLNKYAETKISAKAKISYLKYDWTLNGK